MNGTKNEDGQRATAAPALRQRYDKNNIRIKVESRNDGKGKADDREWGVESGNGGA